MPRGVMVAPQILILLVGVRVPARQPFEIPRSLFPALPKAWDGKKVSFRDLRLPGGHRVTAKRMADGTVTHVLVANPDAGFVPKLAK